jgi:hypothetical protein
VAAPGGTGAAFATKASRQGGLARACRLRRDCGGIQIRRHICVSSTYYLKHRLTRTAPRLRTEVFLRGIRRKPKTSLPPKPGLSNCWQNATALFPSSLAVRERARDRKSSRGEACPLKRSGRARGDGRGLCGVRSLEGDVATLTRCGGFGRRSRVTRRSRMNRPPESAQMVNFRRLFLNACDVCYWHI